MDYEVKAKIDVHGKAVRNDAVFSIARLFIVYLVVAVILKGEIDVLVAMLMALYGAASVLTIRRKMKRDRIFYTFEPGNPAYDYLAELGSPDSILDEIDAQIKGGRVLFSDVCGPKKSSPETIITDSWFVYLNKKATILPLDKIVCAYLYDNVTRETPDERFLPTHFKPIFLIITYGERREAIFRYSSINYKEVLKTLDERLGCKVTYTRELGTLFNQDYPAFLKRIGEARGGV